jgi:hypothetical protein
MEETGSSQPPKPPPKPAKSQSDIWIPRALAALGGTPAVLGVIKTLAETGTGQPFTLSDAAYYVGWAAMGALIGAVLMGALAAALSWIGTEVLGIDLEDRVDTDGPAVLAFVALAYAACSIYFVVSADPPAENESAGFFRVLGIITVVGGSLAYAAFRGSTTQDT